MVAADLTVLVFLLKSLRKSEFNTATFIYAIYMTNDFTRKTIFSNKTVNKTRVDEILRHSIRKLIITIFGKPLLVVISKGN